MGPGKDSIDTTNNCRKVLLYIHTTKWKNVGVIYVARAPVVKFTRVVVRAWQFGQSIIAGYVDKAIKGITCGDTPVKGICDETD